jgi:peptide/nickel transport system permease protein
MVNAVNTFDYNLIMGITVMISVVVLLTNIILDLVYAALDPRISQEA